MNLTSELLYKSQNRQRLAIYSLIFFNIFVTSLLIAIVTTTINNSDWHARSYVTKATESNTTVDTQSDVLHPGFPIELAPTVNYGFYQPSSVILADLDSNGKNEIIVYGRKGIDSFNSRLNVQIINDDGTPHTGWPKDVTNNKPTTGVAAFVGNFGSEATPAVGDINGDGKPEIIIVGYDYNAVADKLKGVLHAYRSDGTEAPGWPYIIPDTGIYNQAIGQIEVGTNPAVLISGRNVISREKFVYAINGRGQLIPGFPVSLGIDENKVGHQFYPLISLSDLDNNGSREILSYNGSQLFALDGKGKIVNGWPVKLSGVSPFVKIVSGDVNGDNLPEIFITSTDKKAVLVHGYSRNGAKLPGWEKRISYNGGAGPNGVTLADLDNDNKPEVLLGFCNTCTQINAWKGDGTYMPGWPVIFQQANTNFTELLVFDADNSSQLTVIIPGWGRNPGIIAVSAIGQVKNWPYYPQDKLYLPWYSSPAVGDLDGNGTLEFIVVDTSGRLYVWNLPANSSNMILWPMFGNNPTLDGAYKGP